LVFAGFRSGACVRTDAAKDLTSAALRELGAFSARDASFASLGDDFSLFAMNIAYKIRL